MKTKTKIVSKAKRKTSKRQLAKLRSVCLAHAKHPVLRHFKLVEHKHTGKLIHFKNTSHLALSGVLLVVGFFLFANSSFVSSITHGGSVSVGVVVPGKPPSVGAVITSPLDGARFTDQNIIEVSGTCSPESFVVVKDNNVTAGSASCTTAGIFVMNIQISSGNNSLTALNYDNLNQAGPVTPSVVVSLLRPTPVAEVFIPILPSNPSIIPGLQPTPSNCNDYKAGKLPVGGEPRVAVVCVPRLFAPKIDQVLGILVWGGAPPYALSINFSDGESDTLVSIPEPGYVAKTFNYEFPGMYRIDFRVTDTKGQTSIVQTSVQANGVPKSSGSGSVTPDELYSSNPAARALREILQSEWFQSPVPFYLLAVAVTLGFWGGDIFARKFGAGRFNPKIRKAATSRSRA